jgi:hypothetical protein
MKLLSVPTEPAPTPRAACASCLGRHWQILSELGFVTEDEPVFLRQSDEPTYVEIFTWVGAVSRRPTCTRTCSPSGNPWSLYWKSVAGVPSGDPPLPAGHLEQVNQKPKALLNLTIWNSFSPPWPTSPAGRS